MRITWVCGFCILQVDCQYIDVIFKFISAPMISLLTSLPTPAGERRLPAARLEEIIFVLQELARLKIHLDTASILPLHPSLKGALAMEENKDKRPHLIVLFPSFCELVVSRLVNNFSEKKLH